MAGPDKPFWRDMHQETADELFTGNRDIFPLTQVLIVFLTICRDKVIVSYLTG